MLVVVAAALGALGFLLGRGNTTWHQAMQFKKVLDDGGSTLLSNRPALENLLDRASERANANVTLYDPIGQVLATNVDPPLPPLNEGLVRQLGSDPVQMSRPRWVVVLPVRERGDLIAYAVAEWRGPGAAMLARGFSYIGGVLLVLALASIPLVRTIVSPLEKLTRAARALGSGDLTARSGIGRRKDEVGELAAAFDEMGDRLERLVRNERELLANVSHELRTPLSRIRVALELAAEGDAARAQKYLREIGSDLAELEQLVEDVLTTAKLEAQLGNGDPLPLHKTSISVVELIDTSTRRFRESWPERKLEADAPEDLPHLDADPVLLRRVLDNLLDNARKYSEDDKPIRISASADDQSLRIDVRDEGIGMTEEDLRQLFTPFFRTDRSRARGTGGVGLGLALARRIIEAHGGTLTAQSAPGQGSTFSLLLPRHEPQR